MTFLIADRVRESSVTTGTGNITLGGAVVGYQTFDAVLNTGDTTFYVFADQAGGPNWEVGIGTFTAPSTLARTTILSSSNSGNIVNFGAGTKDVFISLPASETNAFATGPDIAPSLLLDFANLKELDPRITFTRASTATYYDGKTWAKAEENLLLRSQDYSASWVVTNLTPVTGKTAPDSTSTATEFTASAANGTLTQSVTVLAGDYTFSVWLRRVNGTGNVDISAHSGGTWVTQTLTSTWTRFTVTQTLTAGARTPGIRVVTSGDAIEVWGAQLEQRSAVTAYTPTTTQPITNYIPALQTAASGVARFDHDPVTVESLGLLIEEQRTNQLLRSEEFDDAYWVKGDATITANTIVAPDGTLTGDALVSSINGGLNTCFVNKQTGVAASTNYTYSVFIKKGTSPTTTLNFYRASPFSQVLGTINWSTETMSVSGTILLASSFIPVGNGWYRASLTINSDTATSLVWRIYVRDQGTANVAGEYVFIWGAQLEAGAFPTSYIKTEASQVTRSADAASMTGANFSSWYRQDEGTIFMDAFPRASTVNQYFYSIYAAPGSSRIEALYPTGPTIIRNRIVLTGGVVASLDSPVIAANAPVKFALAMQDGSQAASYNGITPATATAITINDLSRVALNIGVDSSQTSSRSINGTIAKLAYYPKRLTNAQLQALTR